MKQGQVIVISGVAGTGKSFILSHFYQKIKELKPNHWVVAFNLTNHCKALSHIGDLEINDSDTLIKFLIDHFAIVISNNSCFVQSLLSRRLKENGNITFLLDGFDEISSELQKKTVSFTKALINLTKVDQVFITTRPHMNETLQDAFHQFVFNLELLEEQQLCNLIVNYWKSKLDENLHDEDYMQQFAQNLVEQISNSLKDEDREFIGVPLQCHILSECFKNSLKEALENKEQLESLIEKCTLQDLDLVGLYQRLIKEKLTIYNQDKIKTNELNQKVVLNTIKANVMTYLTKLAVTTILATAEDADILLNRSFYSICKSQSQQHEENNSNVDLGVGIGLLNKNGYKVEFLHRTYAEYLVADYIFQAFHFDDDRHNGILNSKSIRNLLVKKIFKNDLYEGVMRFLNCMLKSFVESNDWRRVMNQELNPPNRLKFMAEDICNAEVFESTDQRTLLFFARKHGFANIFIFICDCLEMCFNFDDAQLQLVFGEVFVPPVPFFLSSTMFERLLSMYEQNPVDILNMVIKSTVGHFHPQTQQRQYNKRHLSHEEVRRTLKLALEFLTKWTIKPIAETQNILTFIFYSYYYEDVLSTLLNYLIVFEDDTCVGIITTSFREYNRSEFWKNGKNESILNRIIDFLNAKKPVLVNGLLREILLLGDEELTKILESTFDVFNITNENTVLHRAAFHKDLQTIDYIFLTRDASSVMAELTNDSKRKPTPFYIACVGGNEEMGYKILNYIKRHRSYSDCKQFLLETLKDAILFRKIEMFRVVLAAIKKAFGEAEFEDFLNSDLTSFGKEKGHPFNTVFRFTDNVKMFNAMIGVLISDENSISRQRERLNNLLLQNEWTLEKITLLNENHFQCLVPIHEFEDWLKDIMNRNVYNGFRFISKILHKLGRHQHEQFIRIITETKDDSGSSYWYQWFQFESTLPNPYEQKGPMDRFAQLKKLCEIISATSGAETLIEKLLLHDKGYAIMWGLFNERPIGRSSNMPTEIVFDYLFKAYQNMFAKKWIEFLPDVIYKAYSKYNINNIKITFKWLNHILPIAEYADEEQLKTFVKVILEKPISNSTIRNGRSIWELHLADIGSIGDIENTKQFLKIVSRKLGNSLIEQLIFSDDCELSVPNESDGCVSFREYDYTLDMMLSNLNGQHRQKVGDVLIKRAVKHIFGVGCGQKYDCFIKTFPLLVKYSDKLHLRCFVDHILSKDILFIKDIWSEHLCDDEENVNVSGKRLEAKEKTLVTFLKLVRENLESESFEDLIFHEDGRLITRFLLWSNKILVDVILNHLPRDIYKKIATCLIDNTLKEFIDPENSLRLKYRRINTSFVPFLKLHVDNQTIIKMLTECDPSIWIQCIIRASIRNDDIDSVIAFWSVLSQNSRNEEVEEKNPNSFSLSSVSRKQLLRDLRHQTINVILSEMNFRNPNWFTVLSLLANYADREQLSQLVETIMRCFYWKSAKRKYSLWSYYIYYSDEKMMSIKVTRLLECVREKLGEEIGLSKVIELVLHSPDEGDDPVIVRAALNGENELVEVMLHYLKQSANREEAEELIEKILNKRRGSSFIRSSD